MSKADFLSFRAWLERSKFSGEAEQFRVRYLADRREPCHCSLTELLIFECSEGSRECWRLYEAFESTCLARNYSSIR